ncbi:Cytochrome C oxidase, cbb3-type, subunit III [Sphingomonas sp. OV641]|uniref:c-type cytochrome n=1 Tax=Sphingomonas sp. OV641 TaxID=1881068 RepID=UPI0008D05B56|nr:c-type cytochrome [Sphingomonas sp. OV641]SEJ88266.1 Cytochrome C oxidase, cbb3-type, subunit III [Sphingomonas sp. OV641]
MRITWLRASLAALVLGLLGLLVAWSGAINVAASSGHWAITDWFLHWVMRNSVDTRSTLTSPREASDPSGLVSAAGHFAAACATCHGAPGIKPSPVFKAATPPAPDLARTAGEWSDRELFWIIDHGVKMTGMPAWPARARQDEIRRMVALVRRLPGMTPAQFDALTGGTARIASAPGLAACAGCHGADGRGRGAPDIPVLGGQKPAYLLAALRAFQDGTRQSAVMGHAASRLSGAEMRQLSRHFAALPGLGAGTGRGGAVNAPHDAAAEQIARIGLPDKELPACASCHTPAKPYPVLAGQKPEYLAARLRQMRGDEKEVDARQSQATMPVIARRIPEEMIDRLAAHLAAAPPR